MRKQYNFWPGDQGIDAWDVDRLISLSAHFPVRQIPVESIAELDSLYWYGYGETPTVRSVAEHARLIAQADTRWPIILSYDGRVMDGMHRIVRALLDGQTTIDAVQFTERLEPDYRTGSPDTGGVPSPPPVSRTELVGDLGSLRRVLDDAARSVPPPADHGTVHIPIRPGLATAGVFGFTAHHIVAAEVDHEWLRTWTDRDPFAAMSPEFVTALATETGGSAGVFDTVLVLPGSGVDPASVDLVRSDLTAHSRVRRASAYRTSLTTYSTPDGAGVAMLGHGVAGRLEAAFEVEPAARGAGPGRHLASAIAAVAPRGVPVFFQCAPGNVASLRAILASGARPIGSEILISTEPDSHV